MASMTRRTYYYVIGAFLIGLLFGGALTWVIKPTEVTEEPTEDKYMTAAHEFIGWIGEDTVLTPEELKEEVEFFVTASEPYRGQSLHIMYEAIPPAEWEDKNLRPWFEKITGIKTTWESMSNWETILKSQEDAKLKEGIYDVIGSDQDMIGFYSYHESGLDITEIMEEHPELVPPHIDLEDFYARATYSNYKNGHLMALLSYNCPHATAYRKDWFTDPKNKEEFEARYGYELKTPMEYYIKAQETGKLEDDWTIEKATDAMEFFTRPDEDMWGMIPALKVGDHLGWLIGDGLDDAFQLASPAPPGKDPIEVTGFSPITQDWGISIDEDNVVHGAMTEHGGALDGPVGIAMYEHYIKEWPKYGPPKSWEVDAVEAHMVFGLDGNIALMYPHYCWFTSVYNSNDSKIKGNFEYGPQPVYGPAYEKGKPRGYIDPSGWVISAYTDKPEASFLFAAFMTSKANDLKKNLEVATPIRWSTIMDPKMDALNEKMGGIVTLWRGPMKDQSGTDARLVFYPEVLTVIADATADCFEKELSGEETASIVAKVIDDWLIENDWMDKEL